MTTSGNERRFADNAQLSEPPLFHKSKRAAKTIGLYQREVKVDFGVIKVMIEPPHSA
jgi:hypothetical protein